MVFVRRGIFDVTFTFSTHEGQNPPIQFLLMWLHFFQPLHSQALWVGWSHGNLLNCMALVTERGGGGSVKKVFKHLKSVRTLVLDGFISLVLQFGIKTLHHPVRLHFERPAVYIYRLKKKRVLFFLHSWNQNGSMHHWDHSQRPILYWYLSRLLV